LGKLISETNTAVDLIYGFTGKQLDEATELQHNLNRWYDATLGQWVSEDPISFAAGDENIRRYVRNRASESTDSTGLEDDYWKGYWEAYFQSYDPWVWDNPQPSNTVDYALEMGTRASNVVAAAAAAAAAALLAAEAAAAARAAFMREVAARAARKAAEDAAREAEYFRRMEQQFRRYGDGRK
jgi:RHS repeat-associated protein